MQFLAHCNVVPDLQPRSDLPHYARVVLVRTSQTGTNSCLDSPELPKNTRRVSETSEHVDFHLHSIGSYLCTKFVIIKMMSPHMKQLCREYYFNISVLFAAEKP